MPFADATSGKETYGSGRYLDLEILGCHILGTEASTLVQGVATLMRAGETVDAVRSAIFVHPALPEVVQRAFGELPID